MKWKPADCAASRPTSSFRAMYVHSHAGGERSEGRRQREQASGVTEVQVGNRRVKQPNFVEAEGPTGRSRGSRISQDANLHDVPVDMPVVRTTPISIRNRSQ
jgi:hypothetical protein